MLLADLPHELVHDHLQGGGHPGFGYVLALGGVRVEGQVVKAYRPFVVDRQLDRGLPAFVAGCAGDPWPTA